MLLSSFYKMIKNTFRIPQELLYNLKKRGVDTFYQIGLKNVGGWPTLSSPDYTVQIVDEHRFLIARMIYKF